MSVSNLLTKHVQIPELADIIESYAGPQRNLNRQPMYDSSGQKMHLIYKDPPMINNYAIEPMISRGSKISESEDFNPGIADLASLFLSMAIRHNAPKSQYRCGSKRSRDF